MEEGPTIWLVNMSPKKPNKETLKKHANGDKQYKNKDIDKQVLLNQNKQINQHITCSFHFHNIK